MHISYNQLSQEERYQIYVLKKASHSITEIARILGRHKSSISRELRRNKGRRGYRPKQAHSLALNRRQSSVRKRISDNTWSFVESLIRLDWSPEQISLWLKHKGIRVSHEWIYQYILKDKRKAGSLYKHLRSKRKRRKRYGSTDKRGRIVNRISIDERPELVDKRLRIGDWEVDTIIGKKHKQAIVSLVERKSRFLLIKKVETKTAAEVSKVIISLLKPEADLVHTITSDNGKEFAYHKDIAKALNTKFYFANPYSPWERASNENTNGLIRQYFPKTKDFRTIGQEDIDFVMNRINNRPRKCLAMKTPNQVLFGINPVVAVGG